MVFLRVVQIIIIWCSITQNASFYVNIYVEMFCLIFLNCRKLSMQCSQARNKRSTEIVNIKPSYVRHFITDSVGD